MQGENDLFEAVNNLNLKSIFTLIIVGYFMSNMKGNLHLNTEKEKSNSYIFFIIIFLFLLIVIPIVIYVLYKTFKSFNGVKEMWLDYSKKILNYENKDEENLSSN